MDGNYPFYQYSQKYRLSSLVNCLLVSLMAAAILGTLYGLAIYFIPFVFFNFLLTLAFGLSLGGIIGGSARLCHIRKPRLVLTLGFVFGMLAYYISWVVWLHYFDQSLGWTMKPMGVWQLIKDVDKTGAWHIQNVTPTGALLFLFWLIESLTVIFLSALIAYGIINFSPYCERCQRWIDGQMIFSPLSLLNGEDLTNHLIAQDLSDLKKLKKANTDAKAFSEIEAAYCRSCEKEYYLSFHDVVIARNKNDNEEKKESVLVENYIIDPEDFDKLKSRWA